jgi:hypothetical protein
MFYNARWYDGQIGHFTSPDTIIPDPNNSLDYDRYSYARYNPVRYMDPSGHFVVFAMAGVAIDIAAVALIGAVTLSVAHNVLPGRDERTAALATAIDQTLSFAKRELTLAEKTQNNLSKGTGIDPKDPISACQSPGQVIICLAGAVVIGDALIKAGTTGGNGEDESNSNFPPTSTPGPTTTPTLLPTPTPTSTSTVISTMTPTMTNTPTSTPTVLPGFTPTPFSPTRVPRHYNPYRYDNFDQ